jgi:2-polyprenyl-6-methoxyphenol hydroxylase-like FAD-dependent oxidoreductase
MYLFQFGGFNPLHYVFFTGVVLVGDASATSDPSWGCGLSLTLRDVRVLRDCLLATDDWHAAAHAYAQRHDRYYGALHRVPSCRTRPGSYLL